MPASDPLRVCIVGLGRAGRIHLQSVTKQCQRLQLLSFVDTDPRVVQDFISTSATSAGRGGVIHSRRELESVKRFDAIEQALEDPSLEAVIVASPTDTHFQMIQKALSAGKHVFAEKPLGNSTDDIVKCYDLAKEKDLCLHVGFQRRLDENFVALKERIAEAGTVRLVKITSRDNPRPPKEYLKSCGNIFHDMLIHDFDMLLFLFGLKAPEMVFACGHTFDEDLLDLNDNDTALVTLKYGNGMMCSIDTSRIAVYGYDQRVEVFGEDGMVCAQNAPQHNVRIFGKDSIKDSTYKQSFPQRYGKAYETELVTFVSEIRSKSGHSTSLSKEDCVLAYQIADAAQESCLTGKAVRFNSTQNN
eukprot:Filipodium_phascolosomae@DN8117_c0_g1_i1.p1